MATIHSERRKRDMFTIFGCPVLRKSDGYKLWIAADKYGATFGTKGDN